jgi:hypothetical protein
VDLQAIENQINSLFEKELNAYYVALAGDSLACVESMTGKHRLLLTKTEEQMEQALAHYFGKVNSDEIAPVILKMVYEIVKETKLHGFVIFHNGEESVYTVKEEGTQYLEENNE